MKPVNVPFFVPEIGEQEIEEVVATLRSGWLTTGPRVRRFEEEFAAAVGAPYAVAVNSCTAALHLAIEALGLKAGQAVLVPAMTFAATAAVVCHCGAVPILVDCDPVTGNLDLEDAARKLTRLRSGRLMAPFAKDMSVAGILPVHVGGLMMDVDAVQDFARTHSLWVVEDAAHAFPSAWRREPDAPWQRCGQGTAAVSCFSFYANKTITTGEGGMAVTGDKALAERMRMMSLHGLSHDAWGRYAGGGSWDYQIVAPGYKYNLPDVAAAIGLHQLARADEMRRRREVIAARYTEALADAPEVETPPADNNRVHSWHLYPVRLRTDRLAVSRNAFKEELRQQGVCTSVHWRPLHLHPYYRESYGWQPKDFPRATTLWERLISLPIFSRMTDEQVEHVIDTVKEQCAQHRQPVSRGALKRHPARNRVGIQR
jgi:dTDP-4-amino-4,6-dideoxygalactose transaminase